LIRDAVVQKWFERTRAFTKQNKTNIVEQSPIVQIKEVNYSQNGDIFYNKMIGNKIELYRLLYLDHVLT